MAVVVGEGEDDRLRSFCSHRKLAEDEGSGVVRSGVSSGLYIAGARRFGGFQKTDTADLAITPAGEVVGWPVRVGEDGGRPQLLPGELAAPGGAR